MSLQEFLPEVTIPRTQFEGLLSRIAELQQRVAELEANLRLNASMLARQTDLQIVEGQDNLPAPGDILGIMPNLTGGKPSERYVKERWRGGPDT